MGKRSSAAMLGLLASLAGCRQILGLDDLPADALHDQMPDTFPCFGRLARACFDPSAPHDVLLDANIDTDTDARCIAISHPGETPDLCVIFGATIDVQGSVVATGTRALVLVATDTVTISRLDVSSDSAGQRGAGGVTCASGDGAASSLGGGGAAGGSFAGSGGSGGSGGGGANGGGPIAPEIVTSVRGGCNGGAGGMGQGIGGVAGAAGGALSIVALNRISINGAVTANGMGGGGGTLGGGGGGGGAGGLIALEAQVINIPGMVEANSGAGGEGASGSTGAAGDDGSLPYDRAAIGGQGNTSNGGDGGNGTAGPATVGANGNNGAPGTPSGAGGGGGGGGAGVVWIKGTLAGSRVSPPPTVN